ncbi:MAG: HEPN domain-containing protein [Candidatus Diapherotrites archaeon]|nr:HEPN domain-containing protein [Candidatus Diapherotrites archaeon]
MAAAEVLYGKGIYEMALFHAQQAVEKCLKALWIEKFREEPPKTHNIQYLARELGIGVRSEVAEVADAYYVTRYPIPGVGTVDYDEHTAKRKMDAARKVYDVTRRLLGE